MNDIINIEVNPTTNIVEINVSRGGTKGDPGVGVPGGGGAGQVLAKATNTDYDTEWITGSGGGGGGDMLASVYDPTSKNADAFDYNNFSNTPTTITAQQSTDIATNNAKNTYPSADATKLSGIEAGAQVNQTDSEIKTAYENNANTNAFTDAEKANLSNQSGTNTGDQDISGIATNASNITDLQNDKADKNGDSLTSTTVNGVTLNNGLASNVFLNGEGNYTAPAGGGGGDMLASVYDPGGKADDAFEYTNFTNTPTTITAQQSTDITTNNAKVGITPTQSSDITTNNAKISYTDSAAVAANTAKVTNATHTGDATGDTTLTLATVNSNVGSFTNTNITVNAKGLITAASNGSALPVELSFALSDETTDLTTGTAKLTFRMPHAMTLTEVRASVSTAPTGSTLVFDINQTASTILSTKLSIDATEKTSTTAATPPVISTSALTDDAEITIDIDQIGATIAGTGAKITLIGTR